MSSPGSGSYGSSFSTVRHSRGSTPGSHGSTPPTVRRSQREQLDDSHLWVGGEEGNRYPFLDLGAQEPGLPAIPAVGQFAPTDVRTPAFGIFNDMEDREEQWGVVVDEIGARDDHSEGRYSGEIPYSPSDRARAEVKATKKPKKKLKPTAKKAKQTKNIMRGGGEPDPRSAAGKRLATRRREEESSKKVAERRKRANVTGRSKARKAKAGPGANVTGRSKARTTKMRAEAKK